MDFGDLDDLQFDPDFGKDDNPAPQGKKEDSFGFDDFNFDEPAEKKDKKEKSKQKADDMDFDNMDFNFPDDSPQAKHADDKNDDYLPEFDDFNFDDPTVKSEPKAAKKPAAKPEKEKDLFEGIDDFAFGEPEPAKDVATAEDAGLEAVDMTAPYPKKGPLDEFPDFDDFNVLSTEKNASGYDASNYQAEKSSEKSSAKTSRSSSRKGFFSNVSKDAYQVAQPQYVKPAPVQEASTSSASDVKSKPAYIPNSELAIYQLPYKIPVEMPQQIMYKSVYRQSEGVFDGYNAMAYDRADVSGTSALFGQLISKIDQLQDGKNLCEIKDQLRATYLQQRQMQDDLMSFQTNVNQQITQAINSQLGLINYQYSKLSSLAEQLEQKMEQTDQQQYTLWSQKNQINQTHFDIEQRTKEVVRYDEEMQMREQYLKELKDFVGNLQSQAADVLNSTKLALSEINSAKQVFEKKTLSFNFDALQAYVSDILNRMELIENPPNLQQANPAAIRTAVKLEIQQMQQSLYETIVSQIQQQMQQTVLDPLQKQFLNYTANIYQNFESNAYQLTSAIAALKNAPSGQNNAGLINFLNAQFIKLQQSQNCEAHVASIKLANERAAAAEEKLHSYQEALLAQRADLASQKAAMQAVSDNLGQREKELIVKSGMCEQMKRELDNSKGELFSRECLLIEREQQAAACISDAEERKKRLDMQEFQQNKARIELEKQREEIAKYRFLLEQQKTEVDTQQIEQQNQRTFNLYRAYSAGRQQFPPPAAPSRMAGPSTFTATKQNLQQAMQRASRLDSSQNADDRIENLKTSYGAALRGAQPGQSFGNLQQANESANLRAQLEQQYQMMRMMMQQMQMAQNTQVPQNAQKEQYAPPARQQNQVYASYSPPSAPQNPVVAAQQDRKSSSLPADASLVLKKPFTPMPAGMTPNNQALEQPAEVTPEYPEEQRKSSSGKPLVAPPSTIHQLYDLPADTAQHVFGQPASARDLKSMDQLSQSSGHRSGAATQQYQNQQQVYAGNYLYQGAKQQPGNQIYQISFTSSQSLSNPFNQPNELAYDLAKLADQSGISSTSVSATQKRIKPLPHYSEFSTEINGSASGSQLFNDSESIPNVRFDSNIYPNNQVRNPFEITTDNLNAEKRQGGNYNSNFNSNSNGSGNYKAFKYNQEQFNIFGNNSTSESPFFPF